LNAEAIAQAGQRVGDSCRDRLLVGRGVEIGEAVGAGSKLDRDGRYEQVVERTQGRGGLASRELLLLHLG